VERHFDQDLKALKEQLLLMGGRTEGIVRKSIESLRRGDASLARQVFEDDRSIDRLEIDVEEGCLRLLALQQPLAGDLRFITAALKISNDLERVGDHAVNIAGSTMRLAGQALLKPLVDIPRMADKAVAMLHESLDAFVQRDAESARRLVRRDDEVDDLNRQVFRELLSYMIEDPSTITRAMELVLVARNLERVADLATNVAEEVVFIAEARIIKHHVDESVSGEDFARSPAAGACGRTPSPPRPSAASAWFRPRGAFPLAAARRRRARDGSAPAASVSPRGAPAPSTPARGRVRGSCPGSATRSRSA